MNFHGFNLNDPMTFAKGVWPHERFYSKQVEIVHSVRDSVETHVTAGNQLGKDWVAGFIGLSFFLRPSLYFPLEYVREVESQRKPGCSHCKGQALNVEWRDAGNDCQRCSPHTRRVVTTSVNAAHLDVLWGEIGRWTRNAAMPLTYPVGPLAINFQEIRWAWEWKEKNPLNYLTGRVTNEDGMGMQGHHAAYTLIVGDEAAGLDDKVHTMAQGWAKRFLYFGNPFPCQNFWRKAIKAGRLETADEPLIVGAV